VYGADGQVWVLATPIMLTPGEVAVIEITYEVDETFGVLEIEPSARFPAVRWRFGDHETDDGERFALDLGGD
jgi:hypothetical protein